MISIKGMMRNILIGVLDLLVLPIQFAVTRKFRNSRVFVQVHDYAIYGHLALVTEIVKSKEYLQARLGMKSDLVFWSIGTRRMAVNRQLFRMVKRSLCVLPSPLVSAVIRNGNRWRALAIPSKYSSIALLLQTDIGVLNKCQPQLHFSKYEENKSRKVLEKLKINDPSRVVCLYLRDSKYLEVLGNRLEKSHHRNVNLDAYVEAVDYLCNAGFSVVRMGKHVNREFPYKHANFVDYACSLYRCDELDFFVPRLSIMGITSGTGMDAASFIFRRPTLMIDNGSYGEIPFQLSNLWWRPRMMQRNGKLLSLYEILSNGIGKFWRHEEFHSAGVELLSSSSYQIMQSVARFSQEVVELQTGDISRPDAAHDFELMIGRAFGKQYYANLCLAFTEEFPDWAEMLER
jgi:putative glycosyltransferase (TIGR04372 family)